MSSDVTGKSLLVCSYYRRPKVIFPTCALISAICWWWEQQIDPVLTSDSGWEKLVKQLTCPSRGCFGGRGDLGMEWKKKSSANLELRVMPKGVWTRRTPQSNQLLMERSTSQATLVIADGINYLTRHNHGCSKENLARASKEGTGLAPEYATSVWDPEIKQLSPLCSQVHHRIL